MKHHRNVHCIPALPPFKGFATNDTKFHKFNKDSREFVSFVATPLEEKPEPELQLPGRVGDGGDSPRRGLIEPGRRVAQINLVEDIERLDAKLQLRRLPQGDVLKHGEIDVHPVIDACDVAPGIPE
jgi:hypothetical protein